MDSCGSASQGNGGRPGMPSATACCRRVGNACARVAPPLRPRDDMIELHYWPTPNGHKITLLLEELVELGHPLAYTIRPVDIGQGAQFEPSFLAISPNNRMPAMVDTAPAGGGAPVSVFESGAILLYLAEKTGHFLPRDLRSRFDALQWLFWQAGGLGPMTGQHGHFSVYAPLPIPYAI